jgi:hypothetical protein
MPAVMLQLQLPVVVNVLPVQLLAAPIMTSIRIVHDVAVL